MRDRCAICGAFIDPVPVEGTDPEDSDDSWYEVYECRRGHTGRLEVDEPTESNGWQRTETYTGALGKDPEVTVL